MDENRPVLCISDLQIPFEAEKALQFCLYIQKHNRIPTENIICMGDETDSYFGGHWPKDPNGMYSATGELAAAREKLKEWYAAFPLMKVCTSNHGMRWLKKATAAEIPSQLLRSYKEIFHAPEGWEWKDEWIVKFKHPFRAIHGVGYGGILGAKNAALDAGISTAIGHLAAFGGVNHMVTGSNDPATQKRIWSMNTGALIDVPAYAFAYGKDSRNKPTLGTGIIVNRGSTPIFIPYEV